MTKDRVAVGKIESWLCRGLPFELGYTAQGLP